MTAPSARDRAAELLALAREIDSQAAISDRAGQLDELEGIAARLRALAGVPHPGVKALLARCERADHSARYGSHTPASWGVGLLSTTAIRALLGHTTTEESTDG